MTTGTLVRKLNKEVGELKSDIKEIRRFLFAPPKDAEGKYKKSFIKKVLARTQSVGPFYRFSNTVRDFHFSDYQRLSCGFLIPWCSHDPAFACR